MIYKIQNDKLCALVSDIGAELISVTKNGKELIWQNPGEFWGGHAPLLFPICGRLLGGRYLSQGKEYEMPIHGFTRHSTFSVDEYGDSRVIMSISSNEETKSVYPFDFKFTADYSIIDDQLCALFSVENTGGDILPYMFGWHPGFALDGDEEIGSFYVDFEGKKKLSIHSEQNGGFVTPEGEDYVLENGRYYLIEDDLYKKGTAIFTETDGKVSLHRHNDEKMLELSYTNNLHYLCIWKSPSSKARFVCLEPWSGIPADGITQENFDTRKMSRLQPGNCENYECRIKFY